MHMKDIDPNILELLPQVYIANLSSMRTDFTYMRHICVDNYIFLFCPQLIQQSEV